MSSKIFKFTSLITAVIMTAVIFGACTKGGETTQTASATKSATATAAKTTAKATASASAAAVSASASASTAAAADATSAGGETVVEEDTSTEIISSGDWAQDVEIAKDIGILVDDGTDLKGATVILGSWTNIYNPVDTPEASPEFVIWARRLKAAEQKYNFKTELYVEPGFNSTKYRANMIQQAMSGVVIADIFRTASSYDFPSNVRNGVIVPIDEYVDFEAPIYKANAYMYNASYWKGRRYGVTYWFRYACEYLMYNKDIIDREGQPDILDLVESKQWTWSTFLDIAKNTTKDIDGNGTIDQYGVTAPNAWYIFKYFLYSNGLTSGAEYDENTKDVYLILKTPPSLRTFQFVSDLAFVHKVYITNSATTGVYPKGMCAMLISNYGGPNRDLLKLGMNTKLAVMPMGPDATNFTNTNASQFYVLSVASKYPKEISQIFAETMIVWSEDGLNWSNEVLALREKYFPADWDWNPNNPQRYFATEREFDLVYRGMYPYFKPDFTDGFTNLSSRMQTLIANPLLAGSMSVVQAIDAAVPELESIIDAQK